MNRDIRGELLCSHPIEFRISSPSRSRIYAWHRPNASPVLIRNWIAHLFLAVKNSGNFAQQLVLLLPARLERPPNSESIREQERSGLKMVAAQNEGLSVGFLFV